MHMLDVKSFKQIYYLPLPVHTAFKKMFSLCFKFRNRVRFLIV